MAFEKKIEKDEAFRVYRELRNDKLTAEALGITKQYVGYLRREEKWEETIQYEEQQEEIQKYPEKYDKNSRELARQLCLTDSDAEVYVECRTIGRICIEAIRGEAEESSYVKENALLPKNFDSAMKALKMCWDTRDKIMDRRVKIAEKGKTEKKSENGDEAEKLDVIELTREQEMENKRVESYTNAPKWHLPGPLQDS